MKVVALIAVAGQTTANNDVYTAECLRAVAVSSPDKYFYDESTGELRAVIELSDEEYQLLGGKK